MIDELRICSVIDCGGLVGISVFLQTLHPRITFVYGWRQSDEIQKQPPHQGSRVCLFCRLQSQFQHRVQRKIIDGVLWPVRIRSAGGRNFCPNGFHVRPMLCVLTSLFNPALQRCNFCRLEWLTEFDGRHTHGLVVTRDARDEFTLTDIARNDCRVSRIQNLCGHVRIIQP